MFTGIIEETGVVVNIQKGEKSCKLTITGKKIFDDIKIGDSIAVNGVCLTVSALNENSFTADVMTETIIRSSLGILKKGQRVNLERAMPAQGRFGGHIVSGHIDATGEIESLVREGNAVWVTILTNSKVLRYVVEKGSIAIDGISLTVARVGETYFKVSIIPHTGAETTLLMKKKGDLINLECDIIGKYVEKLMNPTKEKEKSIIDMDFLQKHGF
ncbi:MAG: riboflavin synthase [Anaerovoracaceae bacterium]|jgi:riboflavin synthase